MRRLLLVTCLLLAGAPTVSPQPPGPKDKPVMAILSRESSLKMFTDFAVQAIASGADDAFDSAKLYRLVQRDLAAAGISARPNPSSEKEVFLSDLLVVTAQVFRNNTMQLVKVTLAVRRSVQIPPVDGVVQMMNVDTWTTHGATVMTPGNTEAAVGRYVSGELKQFIEAYHRVHPSVKASGKPRADGPLAALQEKFASVDADVGAARAAAAQTLSGLGAAPGGQRYQKLVSWIDERLILAALADPPDGATVEFFRLGLLPEAKRGLLAGILVEFEAYGSRRWHPNLITALEMVKSEHDNLFKDHGDAKIEAALGTMRSRLTLAAIGASLFEKRSARDIAYGAFLDIVNPMPPRGASAPPGETSPKRGPARTPPVPSAAESADVARTGPGSTSTAMSSLAGLIRVAFDDRDSTAGVHRRRSRPPRTGRFGHQL